VEDRNARALRERAERVLPGGVDSPVRAYRAVRGVAPHIVRGEGAHVLDADGNTFIDFVLAYGPHILGHQPPEVVTAVRAQLELGIAYGHTVELEVELAERIVDAVESLEMVRLVSSGTEAAMSAVRLARAATSRDRIVKFAGGYHGHADALLADAGSGVATLGIPGSPGVPAAAVAATTVLPYNDIEAVGALFAAEGEQIAAVIVEPVAGNMGCVPPLPGFLTTLRDLTSKSGALLVLDEVMTGFRVAYGGAQALYGVKPDLSLFGKVIGGGLPVGAYGGRRDLMEQMAPAGPVYQAGTLSGSPPAMAAGCAVLDVLRGDPSLYLELERLGERLERGFEHAAADAGVRCVVGRVGSMVTPFLGIEEARSFDDVKGADRDTFGELHAAWLEAGVLWPPSQFETAFLSTAHGDADVDRTVDVFAGVLAARSARSN
jgi:glutamate-1-semialdehyde 2,1-aminomutase